MPKVIFPYTKLGEEKARAAAKEFGGKYVADSKGSKDNTEGVSFMIGVGTTPVVKKKKKKAPVRRTQKKKA